MKRRAKWKRKSRGKETKKEREGGQQLRKKRQSNKTDQRVGPVVGKRWHEEKKNSGEKWGKDRERSRRGEGGGGGPIAGTPYMRKGTGGGGGEQGKAERRNEFPLELSEYDRGKTQAAFG